VSATELKGKIVGVDADAGMIQVKPKSQEEAISLKLRDATRISGKGESVQDLAVGQSVTLKFAKSE
jgi:hypothetical protein